MSERGENKKEKETFRIEFSTKRRKKPNLTPITNRIGTSSTVTTLPHIFPNSLSLSVFLGLAAAAALHSSLSLSLCARSVLGLSACDFENLSLVICVSPERMMEETKLLQWSVIRSLLAILQWWAFNVTVIIMNKWIFQVLLHFSSCQLPFLRFRFFFQFLFPFLFFMCLFDFYT